MDGLNEKKWFVYLGDHHEGPFSVTDLQAKVSDGQFTAQQYVWAEGMADWRLATDMPELANLFVAAAAAEAPAFPEREPTLSLAFQRPPELAGVPVDSGGPVPVEVAAAVETAAPILYEHSAPAEAFSPPIAEAAPVTEAAPVMMEAAPTADPVGTKPAPTQFEESQVPTPKPKRKSGGLARWGLLLILILGVSWAYMQGYLKPVLETPAVQDLGKSVDGVVGPYLMQAADKYPALGRYISPLPALSDVSPDDYARLKAAAMPSDDPSAPKVAFALSKNSLEAPEFYVAAHLPDGARFDLYADGVPDTLLNHMSFASQAQVVLTKKLGKTSALRFPDGTPLPRGQFNLTLVESDNQTPDVAAILTPLPSSTVPLPERVPRGRKVVVRATMFLGGAKDEIYDSRLKEYHDKLRAKAADELNEIRQFYSLLGGQLQSTNADFSRLRKGRNAKAQQKAWNEANSKWALLDAQMNQSYVKWTPEALAHDYFYGVLYQMLRQTGEGIAKLHSLHQAYFNGGTDPKAFEIQLGEANSAAESSMGALKTKIDQASALPASPGGLPTKDGL